MWITLFTIALAAAMAFAAGAVMLGSHGDRNRRRRKAVRSLRPMR